MPSESYEKAQKSLEELQKPDRDYGTEKSDLDKQIEELTKKRAQLEDDQDDALIKKADSVDQLITDLEKEDRIPKHEVIEDMYRLSKNDEAVTECIKYTERAFEDVGLENLDISDRTKVKYIQDVSEVNMAEQADGPQIFVKSIQKEQKTFWGSHYHPRRYEQTDEVLVIVKLNNGADPSHNTVLEAVVDTEKVDGKVRLKMGASDNGIFRLETQQQFTDGYQAESGYDTKIRRGDIPYEEYLALYKKDHKESLDDYHKRRDGNLDKNPEYTASKQEREDFIESISERYTSQLEAAQKLKEEVQKKLDERIAEYTKIGDEIFSSDTFVKLMDSIDSMMKEDEEGRRKNEAPQNARKIQQLKANIQKLYPSIGGSLIERFF